MCIAKYLSEYKNIIQYGENTVKLHFDKCQIFKVAINFVISFSNLFGDLNFIVESFVFFTDVFCDVI